jgi:hypothetical protein
MSDDSVVGKVLGNPKVKKAYVKVEEHLAQYKGPGKNMPEEAGMLLANGIFSLEEELDSVLVSIGSTFFPQELDKICPGIGEQMLSDDAKKYGLVEANVPGSERLLVALDGKVLGGVEAAHTEENWVDVYVLRRVKGQSVAITKSPDDETGPVWKIEREWSYTVPPDKFENTDWWVLISDSVTSIDRWIMVDGGLKPKSVRLHGDVRIVRMEGGFTPDKHKEVMAYFDANPDELPHPRRGPVKWDPPPFLVEQIRQKQRARDKFVDGLMDKEKIEVLKKDLEDLRKQRAEETEEGTQRPEAPVPASSKYDETGGAPEPQ